MSAKRLNWKGALKSLFGAFVAGAVAGYGVRQSMADALAAGIFAVIGNLFGLPVPLKVGVPDDLERKAE
ncbi:MAG: hypothetical protein ABIN58_11670 [candidate division WOR-3 bacterium]